MITIINKDYQDDDTDGDHVIKKPKKKRTWMLPLLPEVIDPSKEKIVNTPLPFELIPKEDKKEEDKKVEKPKEDTERKRRNLEELPTGPKHDDTKDKGLPNNPDNPSKKRKNN